MFKLRIISAVVMMSVFLICFFVLPPIFFRLFIYIITVILMVELLKLLEHCWDKTNNRSRKIYIFISILVGLLILFISEFIDHKASGGAFYLPIFMISLISWIMGLIFGPPFIPFVSKKKSFQQTIMLQNHEVDTLNQRDVFPIGQSFKTGYDWICISFPFYIILPLTCSLLYLFEYDKNYLFFVLLIIWLADTGAYIAGKRFGKIKIAENISPGKTLEGVVGAIVINVIFMLVVGLNFSEFNIIGGIVFGLIITLLSINGDLFISWIKRSAGVKDTGNLIPGHGGFLDRVDSFLLVLPFAAVIYYIAPLNFLTT